MPTQRDPATCAPSIARGWYLALYSGELPTGAVRALDCVGRKLAAFRSEAGAAALVDAYCPHPGRAVLSLAGRSLSEAEISVVPKMHRESLIRSAR